MAISRPSLSVFPLTPEEIRGREYGCVFAALGYESRSRSAIERLIPKAEIKIALAFPDQQCLAYFDNVTFYKSAGYDIQESQNDGRLIEVLRTALSQASSDGTQPLRILIDVSSQTRSRLAHVLIQCRRAATMRAVEVDLVYSLADFTPSDRDELPMRHIEPVCSSLSGWGLDPHRPPAAVVGLGYEKGKALGAIEVLQADEAWIFIPRSPIEEYLVEVMSANEIMLDNTPPNRISYFDVMDPFETFSIVESLVYGLERDSRPVLLPFGPKMFSVVSMLVALNHQTASVWRISSGEPEQPTDRRASQFQCALRVRFPAERDEVRESLINEPSTV